MTSRKIHFLTLVFTIAGSVILVMQYPDFIKDEIAAFSTIAGLLTVYGIFFTVVEVIRLDKTSTITNKKATDVLRTVNKLSDIRDITKCLSTIEMAMDQVNREGIISASALVQISTVYSSIFHEKMSDDKSEERKIHALLINFSGASRKQNRESKAKLREALLEINRQLSMLGGKEMLTVDTGGSRDT